MTSKPMKARLIISPDNEDKPVSWNVLLDGEEIGYILRRSTAVGGDVAFYPAEHAEFNLDCNDLKLLLETMTEYKNNIARSAKR